MITISGPIQLIKKSLAIFFKKENFVYFLKIYLVLLPGSLASLALNLPETYLEEFLLANPLLVIPVLLFALIYIVIAFWVGVSGVVAMERVISGGELSFKNTYLAAWKFLGKYALLQLLVGLMVAVGFFLLVIPGVVFSVWFWFSGFELVTKGTGIGASLSGSKNLVKGRFWKVLGRFIVFVLFALLVQIIFSFIPFGIGGIMFSLFGTLVVLPLFLLYKELSVQ